MSLFIRSARRTVSARSSILPGTCRFASGGSNAWTGPLDPNTKHYVIIAEDFNEGKGLDRRLAVREQHLEAAKEGKKAGRIEWGGGLLGVDHSDVGEEGAAKHLTGSLLIVKGESIEEVRTRLHKDPYWTAKVFDPSKVRIFPVLKASLSSAPGPSLGQLRDQEREKLREGAMKTLEWLRNTTSTKSLA